MSNIHVQLGYYPYAPRDLVRQAPEECKQGKRRKVSRKVAAGLVGEQTTVGGIPALALRFDSCPEALSGKTKNPYPSPFSPAE